MASFTERVVVLERTINERVERDRESKAIKGLTTTFSNTIDNLRNVLKEHAFLCDVHQEEDLKEDYGYMHAQYIVIYNELMQIWGPEPQSVDVLETEDLREALQELDGLVKDYSEAIRKQITKVWNEVDDDFRLARSIAKTIPDLAIDLERLKSAHEFFNSNASSYNWFQSMVQNSGQRTTLVRHWVDNLNAVRNEHDKLDVYSIKSISEPSRKFLEGLIRSKSVAFDQVSAETIQEIKTEFPELSKKLTVKVD